MLACRSVTRGEAACAEIQRQVATGSSTASVTTRGQVGKLEVRQLDVSSRASIETFAEGLVSRGQAVHLLVHNAGSLNHSERRTEDGVELTLATNYLGPLLLTHRLLPLLQEGCKPQDGRRARVVLVGSRLEKMANDPLRVDLVEALGQVR